MKKLFLVLCWFLLPYSLLAQKPSNGQYNLQKEKKSFQEITEFTRTNFKGHAALFTDGWKIVTSTQKAFEYANQNTIKTAGRACLQWAAQIENDSKRWKEVIKLVPAEGLDIFQEAKSLGAQPKPQFFKKDDQISD